MASQSDSHSRWGWEPGDYFTDPQVVALCEAIEAVDLDEIDRLVKAGADVNAVGKGNMTPLMWAFPDNELARFERLLEHGADPNVVFKSDFGTIGKAKAPIHPGRSVTTLAAATKFPGYFHAVMKHGGDPNLANNVAHDHRTPLHIVIEAPIPVAEKKERLQLLIDKGADLDRINGDTPAMHAVSWFGQYWIALMLLEAGADPDAYTHTLTSKLIHIVVKDEPRSRKLNAKSQADYRKLLQWLADHGETVEQAEKEFERRRNWRYLEPQQVKEARETLVAGRLARETAEALANPDDLRAVPRMIEFLRWQIEQKPEIAADPARTITVLEKLTGEDLGRDHEKWKEGRFRETHNTHAVSVGTSCRKNSSRQQPPPSSEPSSSESQSARASAMMAETLDRRELTDDRPQALFPSHRRGLREGGAESGAAIGRRGGQRGASRKCPDRRNSGFSAVCDRLRHVARSVNGSGWESNPPVALSGGTPGLKPGERASEPVPATSVVANAKTVLPACLPTAFEFDRDLARVVRAWVTLSPAIRAGVLALIDAAHDENP